MYVLFIPMLHRKRRLHQALTSTARMVQREIWLGIRRKVLAIQKKTDLPDAIVIVAFYTLNQDSSQSLPIPIRMSTTDRTPFHHRPTWMAKPPARSIPSFESTYAWIVWGCKRISLLSLAF